MLILTAHDSAEDRYWSEKSGADGYLTANKLRRSVLHGNWVMAMLLGVVLVVDVAVYAQGGRVAALCVPGGGTLTPAGPAAVRG